MSSTHSMNARKRVHAQKPYRSQAFAHRASNFFEARSEDEEKERKRNICQEADGKIGNPTKQKANWRN